MTTKIIHKFIYVSSPTQTQPKAIRVYYACNRAVEWNWLKTDLTTKKVTCKNCKRYMKKHKVKNGELIMEREP